MKKYSILLVEDDEIDIIAIKKSFDKIGIDNDLHVVKNGEDAIEWLDNNANIYPIVILLDINMPKMNGLEFAEELRKKPEKSKTPIVILTTSKNNDDRKTAYELNIAGYILKPISNEEFVNVINSINNYWSMCEFPERDDK